MSHKCDVDIPGRCEDCSEALFGFVRFHFWRVSRLAWAMSTLPGSSEIENARTAAIFLAVFEPEADRGRRPLIRGIRRNWATALRQARQKDSAHLSPTAPPPPPGDTVRYWKSGRHFLLLHNMETGQRATRRRRRRLTMGYAAPDSNSGSTSGKES